MRAAARAVACECLLAGCAFWASAAPADGDRLARIQSQYQEAKMLLAPRSSGQGIDDDPATAELLDRVWSLVRDWAVAYLDEHPAATASELERVMGRLDPDRHGNVIELGTGTFAVASWDFEIGTVFVVTRGAGPSRVAWTITEAATQHRGVEGLDCWSAAALRRPYSTRCGPPFGDVHQLPKDRDGRPRFYVDATYAGNGLTVGGQLGFWEWDGLAARPLLVKDFTFVIDRPGLLIERDGNLMRVHTKEWMRTFGCWGPCEHPRGVWTIRITPEGVEDLGSRCEEPEFPLIDALFYRVAHGQDASDLAAPGVVARLAPFLSDAARGREGGMLFDLVGWRRKSTGGTQVFTLLTLEQAFDFTITRLAGKPYVTASALRDPE